MASIGIFLAWSWYAKGEGRTPARLAEQWPGVYRAVANKYYVDEVYDAVFVDGLALGRRALPVGGRRDRRRPHPATGPRRVTKGASWVASLFDQYVVDGARQRRRATRSRRLFRVFRRAQTGRVQNYALVMGGGLFCLVAVYLLFR